MESRKSSFEDHLSIVESGHAKTASVKTGRADNSLLSKLAEELGFGEGAAPVAEGQKELPGRDPSTVSTEVSAATDGVANPQLVAAGTDIVAQAAGMAPKVVGATDPVLIATGEATVTDANNLNRTDEAVEAAARGAGGEESGELESAAESQQEAAKVGHIIARSFQSTL